MTGKWKMILGGACMAIMLAGCGAVGDDTQKVEQEDTADQPEFATC